MDIVIVLLYLASLLIIWQFVGYPLLMAVIALMSRPKSKDYSFQPNVSIIVPSYNEEKSIKKRIENLLEQDYPKEKYEIILVDSGSKDKTVQEANNFISQYKEKYPKITLVQETDRKGKASAINYGKSFAKEDIILITDANCLFKKDVLKEIMPYFKDPKVGAVGGQYQVQNPDNPITSSWQFYWDLEHMTRTGEAALDSSCLFNGELNAWRKDLVDADVRMLCEDLDMVIKIRRKGFKIEYEPKAIFYEPAPSTAKDQGKQRKRTSTGTIQTIFKHWNYFLLPRDYYSLLIFPSHKSLPMFSPLVMAMIPILYIISHNLQTIVIHAIVSVLIFGLLLALLMLIKSRYFKGSNKTKFSILSIPKIALFVLLNEYFIVAAWTGFIFGKYSVLWEKAETTR